MNQNYKIMRLLVMFDMPVETTAQRREYTKFRKYLLKCGFIMLQYSIYVRMCQNDSDIEKQVNRVKGFKPKYGDIRILKITENQYDSMIMVHGEKSEQENASASDDLVVI